MSDEVTRRQALAAIGGAALLAREARGQAAAEKLGGPKAGEAAQVHKTPMVCCFSQNLAKIPYAELGNIAAQIGYDGVDLTVMDGGHVNPRITNVDLVRAIESVRGAAIEVPMITTTLTSPSDPTLYPILAITGHTQVHLYRTGFWPWGYMPDLARRTAEIRSDLINLLAVGKQYEMTAMIPNRAGGYFGEAVWDANTVVSTLDPNLIGYYFDPSQTAAWEQALLLARPRLKAVAVQDYYFEKSGKAWVRKPCPLGEGLVDWELFFRILAQSRFAGPLSIHYEYQQQDSLSALTKDLEFVRKQIQTAWGVT
jgi:sugar phosphate isomerase/epimerase